MREREREREREIERERAKVDNSALYLTSLFQQYFHIIVTSAIDI